MNSGNSSLVFIIYTLICFSSEETKTRWKEAELREKTKHVLLLFIATFLNHKYVVNITLKNQPIINFSFGDDYIKHFIVTFLEEFVYCYHIQSLSLYFISATSRIISLQIIILNTVPSPVINTFIAHKYKHLYSISIRLTRSIKITFVFLKVTQREMQCDENVY